MIQILPSPPTCFTLPPKNSSASARHAIAARGRFTVALSGGSTPKSLYSLLAAQHAAFDWDRVFLFFGDERHVPPDHPDSNYRMVNEALLTKISIPAENVFRVNAENPDAAAAAARIRNGTAPASSHSRPANSRASTSSCSAWVPTATPRPCFPTPKALKEQSRLVICELGREV